MRGNAARTPDTAGPAVDAVLVAFGVRFRVSTDNRVRLDDLVNAMAPPTWRRTSPGEVGREYAVTSQRIARRRAPLWVASIDGAEAFRSDSIDAVTAHLTRDLRRYIGEFAPRRVFIHSGVVVVDGRAILVPGRTFTGKSTLVAALVSAGATYYSDEYAVLDDRGRVRPFAKPISLRDGSHRGIDHPAEAFGSVGGGPVPVGAVVVTRFREGARYRPRPGSPAEGAMVLIDNAIAARRRPTAVLAAVSRASATATFLKGDRGEAETAARLLLRRFGPSQP